MIPILLLLLTVTTMQAYPGDVLNVTVNDSAVLSVNDSCMYFIESMSGNLSATAGVHELKVGLNCTPGVKEVKADGEALMLVEVQEVSKDYIANKSAIIERENLLLKKQVGELKEKVVELNKTLKDLRDRYEESERQNELLKLNINLLQDQIKSLQTELNESRAELAAKKLALSDLQAQLKSMSEQSQIYRVVTFFILSLFIGSYAALVYLSRKE